MKKSSAVLATQANPKAGRAEAKPAALTIDAELCLSLAGKSLAGGRRIALLAEIARAGSITQAAKAAGLSYKGAWDAIEQMSNLAGEALVERVVGGKGGGHTHLTPRGAQLVQNFALIEGEHQRFLQRLNRQAGGLERDYSLMENVAMKTSARNQFAGVVQVVREGAVNDEVELAVIGGQTIVATITRDSRIELGLQAGAPALALIKASSIMLMIDAGSARISARNQLAGEVSRINPGAVNTELVLQLRGGGTIAAIITNVSATAMGLRVGDPAIALFKASSVIVGVAA